MTILLKTLFLFLLTAVAEIWGCYTVWLWLRQDKSPFWLIPGALCLAGFAWLLTLHPAGAAGRTYAAYGGVYVVSAIVWLWFIEKQSPDRWDFAGASLCLAGMTLIMFGPR
ncbi:YnfA family protein [bacterium]|nr:YnfA family protein [bacterium]